MTLDVKIDPLGLRYRTVVRPDQYEDGTIAYIAEVPELPGCRSHGATVEEALRNLADAQREYLEALHERGLPIPTPSPDPIATAVIWRVVFPRTEPARPPLMAPSAVIR
ncbi:MAG: type II toxin-antitoxin system HicB family antitoxin [Candidatus Eisenbacteria bacterium]